MSVKNWITNYRKNRNSELEQDMLYDDSEKTDWQKVKSTVRDYWDRTKWPLALVATVGAIYGAGKLSNAHVISLDRVDVNGDGVKDDIVIYPINGTDKGLIGYIDGTVSRNLPYTKPRGGLGPTTIATLNPEYDVFITDFTPIGLQIANSRVNQDWLWSKWFYVDQDSLTKPTLNEKGKPIRYLLEANESGLPGLKIGVIQN